MMKRPVGMMDERLFLKILNQIQPFSEKELFLWNEFLINKLSKTSLLTSKQDIFNFKISCESLTFHGFGDPLLDKFLLKRISNADYLGFKTYFSCKPYNINTEFIKDIVRSEVTYLKYALDTSTHKIVDETINIFEQMGSNTLLVLCMLELKDNKKAIQSFVERYKDNKNVFAYVKSAHNNWYNDEVIPINEKSHYMKSFCEYPFMSVTVLYDGSVVPCSLDFDGLLSFGNLNDYSLFDIWHGKRLRKFRKDFSNGGFDKEHFCVAHCDLKTLSDCKEK